MECASLVGVHHSCRVIILLSLFVVHHAAPPLGHLVLFCLLPPSLWLYQCLIASGLLCNLPFFNPTVCGGGQVGSFKHAVYYTQTLYSRWGYRMVTLWCNVVAIPSTLLHGTWNFSHEQVFFFFFSRCRNCQLWVWLWPTLRWWMMMMMMIVNNCVWHSVEFCFKFGPRTFFPSENMSVCLWMIMDPLMGSGNLI